MVLKAKYFEKVGGAISRPLSLLSKGHVGFDEMDIVNLVYENKLKNKKNENQPKHIITDENKWVGA